MTQLQLLDLGDNQNVKHHIRGLLVWCLLDKFSPNDSKLKISLLDALQFIAVAGHRVTPVTITNCFGNCSFFRSSEVRHPELEEPAIEDCNTVHFGGSVDYFLTVDVSLATCGVRTVEDIVH